MESEVALNYAKALFELISKKDYEAYLSAWEELTKSLQEPDWEKFLSSYSISKDDKYAAMDRVYQFKDAPHFPNFLKVIVAHNRVTMLPQIESAFRSLVYEAMGIKEGILFSSVPLEKKEVQAIEKVLSEKLGAQVRLKEKVDHTLLGGVKVNIDGKVYDGTLRARLQELHRSLKGGSR